MKSAEAAAGHGVEARIVPQTSVRAKIRPLGELGRIAADARNSGKVVVLAHGAFDLLHMGHVRHLEQARNQGDVLVVTVTDDRFVNKGPGRPVFSASLRAEMLAALSYVDWVGINHEPSAETVIQTVKPHVYVKGSEYARAEDDLTGKISAEQHAVEDCGGRIYFTEDVTFSSSTLLNRHFDVFSPEVRSYLEGFGERHKFGQIFEMIESVADKSVLLVGDTIIDEYQYVMPLGKSPKENLIPTLYRDKELFAGGVIAAANHVANFCRQVDVLTCLGDVDDGYEDVVRATLSSNVRLHVVRRHGAPTTRKCRYIDRDYFRKMFEVYFMEDSPISGPLEAEFVGEIERLAPQSDVVIVTDFGHGLITKTASNRLLEKSKFIAVSEKGSSK